MTNVAIYATEHNRKSNGHLKIFTNYYRFIIILSVHFKEDTYSPTLARHCRKRMQDSPVVLTNMMVSV